MVKRLRRWTIRRVLNFAVRGLSGIPDVGLLLLFRRLKRLMYRSGR
ncbi:MAG: hypothetical protein JSV08_04565 [Acidobacteriota bacterium]|nr:MAG: hypothetical protein JSV08_04565 [Acidobacteriota bacterium]